MSAYSPFIIIGILNGSVYAMAALGLTFTYRTTGVFNFGQGAIGAGAAYFFYELRTQHHIAWPLALGLTVLIFGIAIGLALERLSRTRGMSTPGMRIVATVAVMVVFQALIIIRYGGAPIALIGQQIIPLHQFTVFGAAITSTQIFVTAFVAVAAIGLYLWVQHTRIGARSRAVVDNAELLALAGVNPNGVRRWAWCVGCTFAVVAGVLATQVLGSLESNLLTLLLVNAFAAVAIGAFRSLPLTYAGGLIVGLVTALTTKFVGPYPALGGLPEAMPFLLLFAVLLLLPSNRNRVLRRRIGTSSTTGPGSVRSRIAMFGTGAIILVLAPHVIDQTKLPGLTGAVVGATLFFSLGLLVRLSGQVSLCQYTFAAVGAVTFSHLMTGLHLPWGVAVLLSGLIVVPIGAALALPAIRLSGVYLALATFGFGILVSNLFYNSSFMFGVAGFIPAPRPAGFTSPLSYYYLVLVVVCACAGVVFLIHRSRIGRLLRGMADSPTVVETNGTDLRTLKVTVFCISAFLAGIFGALIGPVTNSITPTSFDPFNSLTLLAVLAIAGAGVIRYGFVGGIGLFLIPVFISNATVANYLPLLFGVSAIATAALVGSAGNFQRRLARWKSRVIGRGTPGEETDLPAPAVVSGSADRASLGVER
jgi:branched-subunit amino acid ABC-type transport system permease component